MADTATNETFRGWQLVSRLDADAQLTVELVEETITPPTGTEVVIKVEAAPVNPSDLALLFGPADLAAARYEPRRLVAPMPQSAMAGMAARVGEAMPVGNEGAGTVIAAGEAPEAQALLGKRVAAVAGGMYAQFRKTEARACLPLPDGTSARDGASAFVNPMTALSFVETMRMEGHTAIVHTAAASNLGQMLVRICQADGVPLVNVVRKPEQARILRDLGAEHVVDSSAPDFAEALLAAVKATGATLAFDAIGGGDQLGRILSAMERAASDGAAYDRYGSDTFKQGYIYGGLDTGPTTLTRNFGFAWSIGGWLLRPFLGRLGQDGVMRLRQRVGAELTTTFASAYKAEVSLEDLLTPAAAQACNAKATGEKYLIVPHG